MQIPDCIVITGPMGVGKTAVGARLAERLGYSVVDSDEVLELLTGRSGREIARDDGVAALHRLEASITRDAVSGGSSVVIGAAASIADHASFLQSLVDSGASLVYLRGEISNLEPRVAGGAHRRPIERATAERLTRMRQQTAARLGAVVDTTGVTDIDQIVAAVIESLSR